MKLALALAALAGAAASLWAAPGLSGALGAGLALTMLAIAVVDAREFRVPDPLVALALALRGVGLIAAPQEAPEALTRGTVAFLVFFAFQAGFRAWRGREGLGFGDVKLAGVAGAWVDWAMLPYVIEAAALFGLALAFARRAGKIPFAVGFAPAIWLGWWAGRLAG